MGSLPHAGEVKSEIRSPKRERKPKSADLLIGGCQNKFPDRRLFAPSWCSALRLAEVSCKLDNLGLDDGTPSKISAKVRFHKKIGNVAKQRSVF
jgi:hypothetical protein